MIAGGLIWFNPEWRLADPICSLLFAVLVIFTTSRITKQAVHILMQGRTHTHTHTRARAHQSTAWRSIPTVLVTADRRDAE